MSVYINEQSHLQTNNNETLTFPTIVDIESARLLISLCVVAATRRQRTRNITEVECAKQNNKKQKQKTKKAKTQTKTQTQTRRALDPPVR